LINSGSGVGTRHRGFVRDRPGIRTTNRGGGINLVLVARREALLNEVGRQITRDLVFSSRPHDGPLARGLLPKLAEHTKDLDIGLVVSNAGTANPASS